MDTNALDRVTAKNAQKRLELFGDVSDAEYLVAYAERLIANVPVGDAHAKWEEDLQGARRAAVALLELHRSGEPITIHPDDQGSFFLLSSGYPDITDYLKVMTKMGELLAAADEQRAAAPAADSDNAPWLVRNWWVFGGAVIGFLYAAATTGAFEPAGSYRPDDFPAGALVIGVGIAWVIDRVIVKPWRTGKR